MPFFLEPVTLDLVKDHKKLIAVIETTLGESRRGAVVLDTLNRSLAGSESSTEWTRTLAQLCVFCGLEPKKTAPVRARVVQGGEFMPPLAPKGRKRTAVAHSDSQR